NPRCTTTSRTQHGTGPTDLGEDSTGAFGETRGRLCAAVIAEAGAGKSRIHGATICVRRPGGCPRLAARTGACYGRGPRQEWPLGRRTHRVSAAGHGSDAQSCRSGARPGNEPAGAVFEGLACLL